MQSISRHITHAMAVLALFSAPAALATTATIVSTTMPQVLPQPSGVYRFKVGDVQIVALSDGTAPQDLHKLLQGTTAARTDAALTQEFLANPVQTSINVFVLEMGSRHVMIDTGVGDLFGPGSGGRLTDSLTSAGIRAEQIDDILVTHVHPDHVGGLVRGGQTMFPNAVVHFGKPDLNYFVEPAKGSRPHADAEASEEAVKMLKPYLDAGKVATFTSSTEVVPGITATPHPGHTPGSAFYTLTTSGGAIVFVGDIVHAAAVQFSAPGVSIMYDAEPRLAVDVRRKAFAEFADKRTLIAAPHLSFPGVGYVRKAGENYQWVPINYENWSAK
ncbi:MBL fold metallo-hydrolase [Bradyrhizobium sp. 62B]|uniref:MBL fold metallo-hydrolase n=1 Tax=Bradyrhizobium sp. 62B TaxID=2898442 RepID=UPI00255830B8|nr:MBL fold metallo-hydrolase [Bradyrhizobium sp. 62B]